MSLRARVVAVALGVVLPALAQACEMCFSGSPRVRTAFFNMTILLSLLPLAMIFGGAWALRRASGVVLAEELTETDNSAPPAGPQGSKTPRSREAPGPKDAEKNW